MSTINIPDEYADIQIQSETIIEYYTTLMELEILGSKDSEEYKMYVDLIKEATQNERKLYSHIPTQIAQELFDNIDIDDEMDNSQNRIYHRLHRMVLKDDNNEPTMRDGTTLTDVLNHLIVVKSLKLLTQRFSEPVDDQNDSESKDTCQKYLIVAKYNYLSDTPFAEDKSLKANFKLDNMAIPTLQEISQMFGLENDDAIYAELMSSLLASYNNLMTKPIDEDLHLTELLSAIELARIEIIIEYLPKACIQEVINYIRRNYKQKTPEVARYAKRLLTNATKKEG